jgi:hypothetical protein
VVYHNIFHRICLILIASYWLGVLEMTIWLDETAARNAPMDWQAQLLHQMQYQKFYEQKRQFSQQQLRQHQLNMVGAPAAMVSPQSADSQRLHRSTIPSRRLPADPQGANISSLNASQ